MADGPGILGKEGIMEAAIEGMGGNAGGSPAWGGNELGMPPEPNAATKAAIFAGGASCCSLGFVVGHGIRDEPPSILTGYLDRPVCAKERPKNVCLSQSCQHASRHHL